MRGFIYVLSNPELSGLLKIGKTSKDRKNKSDDLYSTGLPAPFKLEYMDFCDDMYALELRVHKNLPDICQIWIESFSKSLVYPL